MLQHDVADAEGGLTGKMRRAEDDTLKDFTAPQNYRRRSVHET